MDIIDYISCVLQIRREIVFTVLTPILIFVLGQLISVFSKKLQNNKELKDKEIYYFELLSLVPNPLLLQAQKLKSYADTLRADDDTNPNLVHMSHIHLNKLNAFPNNEAFHIWVRRKKGDVKTNVQLFNSLCDFIDISQKLLEVYPKIHHEYVEVLKKYQDEYDRNLDLILENMQTLYVNLSPNSQLLHILEKIEREFDETDRSIRSNTYYILIEPLLEQMGLSENSGQFKAIDKNLQRCNQAFSRIQEVRNQFAVKFDQQVQKLENMSGEISTMASKLKSLKNKSSLRIW